MPRYIVERQYLLPVYQHIIVEADNVGAACKKAVEHDDWESSEKDYDGSLPTTITRIVEAKDGDDEYVLYARPELPIPRAFLEEQFR